MEFSTGTGGREKQKLGDRTRDRTIGWMVCRGCERRPFVSCCSFFVSSLLSRAVIPQVDWWFVLLLKGHMLRLGGHVLAWGHVLRWGAVGPSASYAPFVVTVTVATESVLFGEC